MIEILAVIGLLCFWTGLFGLPLALMRVMLDRGAARTWSAVAIVGLATVVLGYTRTMAMGTLEVQVAWSLGFFVPLLAWFLARRPAGTRWRKADPVVAIVALVSFLPANLVLIPTGILLGLRIVLW